MAAVVKQSLSPTISVMTYNILADCYCRSEQFTYVAKIDFLRWRYRKRLLFSSISKFDADIVMLQEVDKYDDFYQYFTNNRNNYDVTYVKRTNKKQDGLMISFRKNKVELISKIYQINFNEIGSIDIFDKDQRFQTDNIAMIVVFKISSINSGSIDNNNNNDNNGNYLIVANCHLHWKPDCADIKLLQTQSLLNGIEHVVNIFKNKKILTDTNYQVILGGDLNSMPDSDIYKLITSNTANLTVTSQQSQKQHPNTKNANINSNDSGGNLSAVEETIIINNNASDDDDCISSATNNINGTINKNDKMSDKKPKFVVSGGGLLYTVGKWLAALDVDIIVVEANNTTFDNIIHVAKKENRIILTRNLELVKRYLELSKEDYNYIDDEKKADVDIDFNIDSDNCNYKQNEKHVQAIYNQLNSLLFLIDIRSTAVEILSLIINYFSIKKLSKEKFEIPCRDCYAPLKAIEFSQVKHLINNKMIVKTRKSIAGYDLECYQCTKNSEHFVVRCKGWSSHVQATIDAAYQGAKENQIPNCPLKVTMGKCIHKQRGLNCRYNHEFDIQSIQSGTVKNRYSIRMESETKMEAVGVDEDGGHEDGQLKFVACGTHLKKLGIVLATLGFDVIYFGFDKRKEQWPRILSTAVETNSIILTHHNELFEAAINDYIINPEQIVLLLSRISPFDSFHAIIHQFDILNIIEKKRNQLKDKHKNNNKNTNKNNENTDLFRPVCHNCIQEYQIVNYDEIKTNNQETNLIFATKVTVTDENAHRFKFYQCLNKKCTVNIAIHKIKWFKDKIKQVEGILAMAKRDGIPQCPQLIVAGNCKYRDVININHEQKLFPSNYKCIYLHDVNAILNSPVFVTKANVLSQFGLEKTILNCHKIGQLQHVGRLHKIRVNSKKNSNCNVEIECEALRGEFRVLKQVFMIDVSIIGNHKYNKESSMVQDLLNHELNGNSNGIGIIRFGTIVNIEKLNKVNNCKSNNNDNNYHNNNNKMIKNNNGKMKRNKIKATKDDGIVVISVNDNDSHGCASKKAEMVELLSNNIDKYMIIAISPKTFKSHQSKHIKFHGMDHSICYLDCKSLLEKSLFVSQRHRGYNCKNGQYTLKHNLSNLVSVYKDYFKQEALYTNYTKHFSGCLDYIFVTKQQLNISKVMTMPDLQLIAKEKEYQNEDDQFLPNKDCPSDHLPVVAQIELNSLPVFCKSFD